MGFMQAIRKCSTMGKRKTKTVTRKKQINKAAKGLAKSFAKKLGVSGEQKPTKNEKSIVVGVDNRRDKALKHKKNNKILSTEDMEFHREQASLNERFRSSGKRKNEIAKHRLQFQPARFAASDSQKTTSQLIAETEQKVQELVGLGGQMQSLLHESSSVAPLGSLLQRSAGPSWTDPAEMLQPGTSHNPWEILGNGDEVELLKSTEEKPSISSFSPPLFQFAPPSFHVPAVDEIDPDL